MSEQAIPLQGIKVVDLTSNIAAPFGAAVLADLGADVVHVESTSGDDSRRMAPTMGDASAYFHIVNRNKSGETLDIRQERDRQTLLAMITDADVFVSNLRPAKLVKYGLDGPRLTQSRPRLVHATLSAYGSAGDERNKPGYDAVLQARTGIASVTGTRDGPPVRAGVSVLDVGAGTWLALGVISALYRRERTGRGGEVATSLFETGANWVSYHVASFQITGTPSGRHGSGHPAFSPYGIYRAGTGEICIGIGSDNLFAALCEAIGAPHLARDVRYQTNSDRVRHSDRLRSDLEAAMAGSSAIELADRLGRAGLPVDAVNRPEHLLEDPQASAIGLLVPLPTSANVDMVIPGLPITFDGERPEVRNGAPARAMRSLRD